MSTVEEGHERAGVPASDPVTDRLGIPSGARGGGPEPAVRAPEATAGPTPDEVPGAATGAVAGRATGAAVPRRSWPAEAGWAAGVFLIALALSFLYLHQAWSHPASTWRGNTGDPEQFMWFLRWPVFALPHGHNPLVTNFMIYPGGANLMWNTSVVLPALLAWPVTALTNATVGYNLLMLLAPATSAAASYLAFRRWAGRFGAAVGGLLFGFSPFAMIHSAGHLQLLLTALIPMTLLLVDEALVRQRWPMAVTGIALGVVAAAQLLTSEEVLAIEAVVGVTGALVAAALNPRRFAAKLPYLAGTAVVAAVTFVVLAGYPLYTQYRGPDRLHSAVHDNRVYVSDLWNLVLPVNQWLGSTAAAPVTNKFTGNASEWTGYLGVPLLGLLAALGIARWRRPVVRVLLVTAAAGWLFSLGSALHLAGRVTHWPLPWRWLEKLPLLGNVLPGRITVVVDLLVAALVAIAIDEVIRARPAVRVAGLLTAATVVASWVPGGLATTTQTTPAFFTGAGAARIPAGSVAVVLPLVGDPASEAALLWQADSGMRYRMPEGWAIVPGNHAGPATATFQAFFHIKPSVTALDPDQVAAIQSEWHRWKVRTVIDVPTPGRPDGVASVVQQIVGARPQLVGGVEVWYDVRV